MTKSEILQKFRIFLLLCLTATPAHLLYAQPGRGFDPSRFGRGGDDRGGSERSRGGFDPSRFGRGGFDPSRFGGGDRGSSSRGGFDPSRFRGGFDPSRFGGGDRGSSDRSRSSSSNRGGLDPSRFGRGGFDPSRFGGGDRGGFDPSRFGRGGDDRDRGGFDPSRFGRGGSDDDARRREEFERRRQEFEARRRGESTSKKSPIAYNKTIEKVEMPSEFVEGDIDQDGQIGFYEWKKWRRDSIQEFAAYDHNGDGFLTPKELVRGRSENVPPSMAAPAVASASTPSSSSDSESTTSSPIASAPPTTSSGTPVDLDSVTARRGANFFRLLDRDRDEQLSGEEWDRARTIKPLFEKAGLDLSKPMAKNDFIANYVEHSGS